MVSIIKDSYSLSEIAIGMSASYSQTITDADVKQFAGISSDHNPIHLDEEYAAGSRFKRRIAHGLHMASFFSGIFGAKFPGKGCIYVSQSLIFKKPVYIGDTVTARVEVFKIDIRRRRVSFITECLVRGVVVTTGTAEILIPEVKHDSFS